MNGVLSLRYSWSAKAGGRMLTGILLEGEVDLGDPGAESGKGLADAGSVAEPGIEEAQLVDRGGRPSPR